jgi:apolipoprotein N-acyltransferase
VTACVPVAEKIRDRAPALLAVAAGGYALSVAYPHLNWDGTAWAALTPVLLTALGRRARPAFGLGWLGGFVFFMVLLRWLLFTFETYSAFPAVIMWLPTALLAGYCALYVGGFAAMLSWLAERWSIALALTAAPFVWVTGEWLRGHVLGGFPWGLLGYSQFQRLPVIQIAEIGGVYAVSFVIVTVNAALVGIVALPWRQAAVGVLVALAVVVGTLTFGYVRLATPPPSSDRAAISVMQPAIEQPLKWDPQYTVRTLDIYFALTRRAAAEHPDLIVWPETASPTLLRRDADLLSALRSVSSTLGVPLVVGSVDVDDVVPDRIYNTAFLVTSRGITHRYDKIHLVPFGEYVPLGLIGVVRKWAEFVSQMEAGSRAVVFPDPPTPFGIVICYEGIFPELFRDFVRGGARVMLNMTNDAWFGRTSGPWQHLSMYPLRAVEHRIAIARAANTGVSAFIAPTGQIIRRMPLFDRGVMTERLDLRVGTTLYTRFGDWIAYLAMAVTAALAGVTLRWRTA